MNFVVIACIQNSDARDNNVKLKKEKKFSLKFLSCVQHVC